MSPHSRPPQTDFSPEPQSLWLDLVWDNGSAQGNQARGTAKLDQPCPLPCPLEKGDLDTGMEVNLPGSTREEEGALAEGAPGGPHIHTVTGHGLSPDRSSNSSLRACPVPTLLETEWLQACTSLGIPGVPRPLPVGRTWVLRAKLGLRVLQQNVGTSHRHRAVVLLSPGPSSKLVQFQCMWCAV